MVVTAPTTAIIVVNETTGDPTLAITGGVCVAIVAILGTFAIASQETARTWIRHRAEHRRARDEGKVRRRIAKAATRTFVVGTKAADRTRRDARTFAREREWKDPTSHAEIMRITRGGAADAPARSRNGAAKKASVTELGNKRRQANDA
jgi:hypothetical protein